MIREAIESQASDLHLIPTNKDYVIQMRIHGQISRRKRLKYQQAERLISHLKYQSGMDIGERRKAQSSTIYFYENEIAYFLRLSTLPAVPSESLAIRISEQHSHKNLHALPLLNKQTNHLLSLLRFTYGLILLTGPTGSGKTTTLYALLKEWLKIGGKRIISIEDPVEQNLEEVVQIQINEKAGITFDSGLKSILRHDPDIIVIGEIRDRLTAELALRMALTGHLVIATLHTHNSYSAIFRLLDFGLTKEELGEALRVILSQRLLLPTCSLCQIHLYSTDCTHYLERKRKAIFEFLKGEELKAALLNRPFHYRKISSELRLAWALGLIEHTELEG
ncbi:hypothetical protein AB990_07275 [Alkalihalobacillus pseudalcaliphilus]|nr:hypothetical protein AB990_07275 [Alkalihalobacillus pseudalcaliphilus]